MGDTVFKRGVTSVELDRQWLQDCFWGDDAVFYKNIVVRLYFLGVVWMEASQGGPMFVWKIKGYIGNIILMYACMYINICKYTIG